jgi:hypothetical protein
MSHAWQQSTAPAGPQLCTWLHVPAVTAARGCRTAAQALLQLGPVSCPPQALLLGAEGALPPRPPLPRAATLPSSSISSAEQTALDWLWRLPFWCAGEYPLLAVLRRGTCGKACEAGEPGQSALDWAEVQLGAGLEVGHLLSSLLQCGLSGPHGKCWWERVTSLFPALVLPAVASYQVPVGGAMRGRGPGALLG